MEALRQVWGEIERQERCDNCPLKQRSGPLLFKPQHSVSVMVITEGPNRKESKAFIASLANHPTFTYLTALAGGEFIPEGKGANVYWTHVRKCFIRDENRKPFYKEVKETLAKRLDDKALANCWVAGYLGDEIKAIVPKLIVAVGGEAKDFLGRFDNKLSLTLEELIQTESKQPLEVNIDRFSTKVAVVPHPSSQNRFWIKPPAKTKKALEMVKGEFIKIIKGRGK